MSVEKVLQIIQKHPEGIWIRKVARKAGVSPATVCNYLYGYKDNKGREIKPQIKNKVQITKIGDGAVTILKPK